LDASSLPALGRDLCLDLGKSFPAPRGHDNAGARLGQAQHDGLADAATAACNNGTAAFKRQ
jgi:hypothetical protein